MNNIAILHVENTDNLIDFATFLVNNGWTLVSANKTEELLKKQKLPVIHEPALSENNIQITDSSTLIRQILLSRLPDSDDYLRQNESTHTNIQIICMNIKPLLKVPTSSNIQKQQEAIPPANYYISTVLRNSFINYRNLLILTDPDDYKEAMIQLRTDNVRDDFRLYLAAKCLNLISAYDSGISDSLLYNSIEKKDFLNYLMFPYKKENIIKSGINETQKACIYRFPLDSDEANLFSKLHLRDFDFNTICDISLGWELISSLYETLRNQLSVKSTNSDGYDFTTQFTPLTGTVFTAAIKLRCIVGSSLSSNVLDSFKKTYTYDRENITNVTLACSAVIDEAAALEIVKCDFLAIVAPGFTDEAKVILAENKNIRLIPIEKITRHHFDIQLINGGLLAQSCDTTLFEHWYVKTRNRPSQNKTDQMAFGMLLASKARSHCAVLLNNNSIVGIAQGASSPNMALEMVLYEAKRHKARNDPDGPDKVADVLICDTAFTFCEIVKDIIENGVSAIIQTGPANNDEEFIQYCNDNDVVLIYTGTTHISF